METKTNEIVKIAGLVMNRATVEETRSEIARRIEEGLIDPVKTMAAIKFYQRVFDGDDKKNNGLTHLIKDRVITEVTQDKTRTDWYGYKVEVKEAGARYDFTNCNDDVLDDLTEKFNEAKIKMEERQNFLKTIKDHLDIITEDGEAKTIYPPVKKSTTSPTFTFSK